MIHALLQSLFVQVTVPVVLTQLFAMRMDKKAFAKMNRSMGKLQAIAAWVSCRLIWTSASNTLTGDSMA